jgi:hypothetical protein
MRKFREPSNYSLECVEYVVTGLKVTGGRQRFALRRHAAEFFLQHRPTDDSTRLYEVSTVEKWKRLRGR